MAEGVVSNEQAFRETRDALATMLRQVSPSDDTLADKLATLQMHDLLPMLLAYGELAGDAIEALDYNTLHQLIAEHIPEGNYAQFVRIVGGISAHGAERFTMMMLRFLLRLGQSLQK